MKRITNSATHAEWSDIDIQRTVRRHVLADTTISDDRIDIKLKDGIVMLSDSVKSPWQKTQVWQLAESIQWVRSVVDTLVVKPIIRDDRVIARDVRISSAQILPRGGLEASVRVDGGAVTLEGTADSWVLSRLAMHKAMSVKAVSKVVN